MSGMILIRLPHCHLHLKGGWKKSAAIATAEVERLGGTFIDLIPTSILALDLLRMMGTRRTVAAFLVSYYHVHEYISTHNFKSTLCAFPYSQEQK